MPGSELAELNKAWPTQPIPVKPPPFARQSMRRDEITDVTPESHAECLQILGDASPQNMFTPWSSKMALSFPGDNGGDQLGKRFLRSQG